MKKNNTLLAAFIGMVALVSTFQSHAQSLIYGLTTTNSLVVFSATGPVATGPVLTGLGVGESAVGIDFRPFTGELYALTSDGLNVGRLYTVNPITGVATPVSLTGALTNINSGVGMDFNPVANAGVNALRIVTGARDNYRITFSGAAGTVNYDGKLNTTNVVAGTNAVAAAYSNNRGGLPGAGGAGGTTLYIIETDTDSLYVQNPPNNGTLVDAKPLSFLFSAGPIAGFDIDTLNNRGYAVLGDDGELVEINLATGEVTFLNVIPANIADLAVTLPDNLPPTLIYGLTGTNTLVPFTTDSTNVGAAIPITGAGLGGRTFVAIDFRPFDGLLYGLARDALNNDAGRLYTIDPVTGAATELSVTGAPFLLTNSVDIDFNPIAAAGANALRVVTGANQDFRLTFSGSTATVIKDGDINPPGANIGAVAYVNNGGGLPGAGGTGGTTLYVIDSATDNLYIQNPPNNGTLTAPKPLVHDVDSVGGLDILTTTNRALAVFGINGTNGLYEVDLVNGFANLIRGLPSSLVDLAVPIPARLTTVSNFPGTNVALFFGGGIGPFNVQKANVVNDPFCSVTTIASGPVTVTKDGPQGFYRVRDLVNANLTRFTAALSGAAAGTGASGFGFGTAELNGDTLTYEVAYTGLTGPPFAAHVHLPAPTTGSANVAFDLAPVGGLGTTGRYSATVQLTLAQKTAILAGLAYFNIHTTTFGGGEIRGQIVPAAFRVVMGGAAERPTANSSPAFGAGAMTLIGNQLSFDISYQGLTQPATLAHFHGAADSAGTAPIIINLGTGAFGALGRSGTLTGRTNLTPAQLAVFADGRAYVNIHNGNFPAGEIRGQVSPYIGELPFSADLTGAAEKPSAVSSPGSGFVEGSLAGSVFSFTITYRGMTSAITAAHIHGPATSSVAAAVLFDLTPYHRGTFGTQGVFSGSVVFNPAQVNALLSGDLYVNLHTAVNPSGEVRGQLAHMIMPVSMNGANERPTPVATAGTAFGYFGLVGRQSSLSLHYRNLSGTVNNGHYHGPADVGGFAGVLLGFFPGYFVGGASTWGFVQGNDTVSDALLANFVDGLIYVNIHSTAFGGGEIRGQVLP